MTQEQQIELWASLLEGKELDEAITLEDIENAKMTIAEYAKRVREDKEISDEEYVEIKNAIQTALSDKKTKPSSPLATDIIQIALSMLVPAGLRKMVY